MTRPAPIALPPILALLVCALALSACGEKSEPEITGVNDEVQFKITGAWKGELRQQGIKPFPVEARIESLARSKQNVVRYGGEIDCAGTWEYLGASETTYRFREVIDRGSGGKCKGTGTVTLGPLTQDSVAYEFRGGGAHSQGRLMRTDAG
jgi:hypothetical protein